MLPTDNDVTIDAGAAASVCGGADRISGLLTKRELDTLGSVTNATKLKADVILDAVEARFGVRPATVWGAGPNPEHSNRRCLDVMITIGGGWLGGSKAEAWEIGDFVADLVWANRVAWGLRHILWRRRIRSTVVSPGVWRDLADRGSVTQNHEDHPHIHFLSDAFTPPAPPVQEDDDMALSMQAQAQLDRIENLLRTGRPDARQGGPEWPWPFTLMQRLQAQLDGLPREILAADPKMIADAIIVTSGDDLARRIVDALSERLARP